MSHKQKEKYAALKSLYSRRLGEKLSRRNAYINKSYPATLAKESHEKIYSRFIFIRVQKLSLSRTF